MSLSFCHECGAKVAPDDPFCGNCGVPQLGPPAVQGSTLIAVEGAGSDTAAAAAPAPAPAEQMAETANTRLDDTESPDREEEQQQASAPEAKEEAEEEEEEEE